MIAVNLLIVMDVGNRINICCKEMITVKTLPVSIFHDTANFTTNIFKDLNTCTHSMLKNDTE